MKNEKYYVYGDGIHHATVFAESEEEACQNWANEMMGTYSISKYKIKVNRDLPEDLEINKTLGDHKDIVVEIDTDRASSNTASHFDEYVVSDNVGYLHTSNSGFATKTRLASIFDFIFGHLTLGDVESFKYQKVMLLDGESRSCVEGFTASLEKLYEHED